MHLLKRSFIRDKDGLYWVANVEWPKLIDFLKKYFIRGFRL